MRGAGSSPCSGPTWLFPQKRHSPATGPVVSAPQPKAPAQPEGEVAHGAPACTGPLFSELAGADSAGRGHSSRSSHIHLPPPDPLRVPGGLHFPCRTQVPITVPRLTGPPRAAAPGSCMRTVGAPGDSHLATGGREPGGPPTTVRQASGPAVGSVTRGGPEVRQPVMGARTPMSKQQRGEGPMVKAECFLCLVCGVCSEQQDGQSTASLLTRWTGPLGGQNGCSCPRG